MEYWQKAVAELARVLKPDGELFYIELFRPFLSSRPVRLLTEHPEGGLFSIAEFISGLEGNGLTTTEVKKICSFAALGAAIKSEE